MARTSLHPNRTEAGTLAWRPARPHTEAQPCPDPQRGPHNRCSHGTPPPVGYRHCQGDPGCPILIPTGHPAVLCWWHHDLGALPDTNRKYAAELMNT